MTVDTSTNGAVTYVGIPTLPFISSARR